MVKMKLNQILLIIMLIGGVFFLSIGKYLFFFFFLIAFISTWFLYKVVDKMGINKNYKILISILLFFHLFGALYLFDAFRYYDKIMHLVVGISITLMIYTHLKRFNLEYPRTTTFFIVLGMLFLWEIFEYTADAFFNLRTMGVQDIQGTVIASTIDDTMQDMIMGALGSIFCLIGK